MDELVEWLRAQLDEDERIARAADEGPWQGKHLGRHDQAAVGTSARGGLIQLDGPRAAANGTHIVRHDPARVLREIDAKRNVLRIAAEATEQAESRDYLVNGPAKMMLVCLKPVLLHFATVYAARPGYREEWRP